MNQDAAVAPVTQHLDLVRHRLGAAVEWLTERERSPSTKLLFRNLFYGWLFLHTAVLVPFHREIWAPDAFVIRDVFDPSLLFHWVARLSLHPALEGLYPLFFFGQLAVLALALMGVAPRLLSILVVWFTFNVNCLATPLLDGGNNLSELLMLYLILVDPSGRERVATGPWSRVSIALSNAGLILLRLQVVAVYLTAGMLKLNGELWQRGMALYYVLQADAFSHPLMARLMTTFPWIGMAGTYLTLAFQWAFPSMVWFRRTRPYVLTVGVFLHLGIAFGMGLLTFGLIMCLVYVLFLEERTTSRVLAWFSPRPQLRVRAVRSGRLPGLIASLGRWSPAGSMAFDDSTEPADGCLLEVAERVDSDHRAVPGVRWQDALALVRLLVRVRWMWPFLPAVGLVLVGWYLGWSQRLFRRWFAPRPDEPLDEAVAEA